MRGLAEFQRQLEGWMTSDGEDFCPDCWGKYLGSFASDENVIAGIQEDSTPTSQKEIAERLICAEGYFAICRGFPEFDCTAKIFVDSSKLQK